MAHETFGLLDEQKRVAEKNEKSQTLRKLGTCLFITSLAICTLSFLLTEKTSEQKPDKEAKLKRFETEGILRFEKLVGQRMPLEDFGEHLDEPPSSEDVLRRLRISRVKLRRPEIIGPEDPFRIAQCVGAIYDLANYVGWAALNVDALSINGTCPDTQDDTTCSVNAVGLVFNLMWVVNFAAQIPVWCVRDFNRNTSEGKSIICLGNLALFFAASLQTTADGLAVKMDCSYLRSRGILDFSAFQQKVQERIAEVRLAAFQAMRAEKPQQRNVSRLSTLPWLAGRRLEADLGSRERGNQLGICSMIVAQLANDLPYAGVDIWAAVQDCGQGTKERSRDDFDEDCTADSLSIISDLIAIHLSLLRNGIPKNA